MKIEMTNGRVTATAETLSDIQKLVALGGGKEKAASVYPAKRVFKRRKCGYCHVVYKSLGNHQLACPQKKLAVEKYRAEKEVKVV
jgi:hypothetical protein